jgi:type I restriction enzyme R subunit
MALHNEIEFERDICGHLSAHGWLYNEGDAAAYDAPRALFPSDVLAWVQATQPQAWDALSKSHGAAAEAMLLDRLRKQLDERGTLEVLRFGIDMVGLKTSLKLAQFKPALAMNPDLQARYAANRLRVVRQVRTNHDDVIDLVLFLNGIPVSTAEIKTDFTQDVNEAVDQYRFVHIPKPNGKPNGKPAAEPRTLAAVRFRTRSKPCCPRSSPRSMTCLKAN